MKQVLLNLIFVTYNNADILLDLNIEYKTPSLGISVTNCSRVWSKMKHEKLDKFSNRL